MRSAATRGAWLAVLFCVLARSLSAQPAPRERIDLSVGVEWFGPVHFPAVDATQTVPGGSRRVVFRSTTTLDASAGVGVRVGIPLTTIVVAESSLSMNRTTLSTEVRGDVEAAALTASEPVTQYLIEGGVRVRPIRWRSARLEPFVSAGGGYLRQVNEGQTLVQTGRSWYVGAGSYWWLKRGGRGSIKSSGLRLDLRASTLERGVAIDGAGHLVPGVGVGLFVRF